MLARASKLVTDIVRALADARKKPSEISSFMGGSQSQPGKLNKVVNSDAKQSSINRNTGKKYIGKYLQETEEEKIPDLLDDNGELEEEEEDEDLEEDSGVESPGEGNPGSCTKCTHTWNKRQSARSRIV